jgi:endonuclease/exonuclease/phosphatase family metal-dependent hydrolase
MRTAGLLLELLDRNHPATPAILTADANSPPGGDVHNLLLTRFCDAWETAAERRGPEGTVHGFGRRQDGRRVDWILLRGPWKPLRIEADTRHQGELYPSDHYPVFADVELART